MIWGINDFDEAHPVSFANDLVRLAVSAELACEAGHIQLKGKDASGAILEGYREGLRARGQPFALEESHDWLRKIAVSDLRDPVHFWAKIDALPTVRGPVPAIAVDIMDHLLPTPQLKYRLAYRVAGVGSLGHPRYVAIADWNGGRIAREAKSLVPSAFHWAKMGRGSTEILYQKILDRAVRCPDPFVRLRKRWIGRRLSPHCSRIELSTLRLQGQELRLLSAMGWEMANVHLGTKTARKAILRYLQRSREKWLQEASVAMLNAVLEDWKFWKKNGYN